MGVVPGDTQEVSDSPYYQTHSGTACETKEFYIRSSIKSGSPTETVGPIENNNVAQILQYKSANILLF